MDLSGFNDGFGFGRSLEEELEGEIVGVEMTHLGCKEGESMGRCRRGGVSKEQRIAEEER